MIIAKSILGRLGNQMFQYAYCKAIKEAVGGSLAFSFDKVYCQKDIDKSPKGFEAFPVSLAESVLLVSVCC